MRIQNDRQVSFKSLKGLHETHNIHGERLSPCQLCLGWDGGWGAARSWDENGEIWSTSIQNWWWRDHLHQWASYCGETGTELKWKTTKKREEIGPVDRGRVTGRCPQQTNWHFFQHYSKPQERRPGKISRLILTWTQLSSPKTSWKLISYQ